MEARGEGRKNGRQVGSNFRQGLFELHPVRSRRPQTVCLFICRRGQWVRSCHVPGKQAVT